MVKSCRSQKELPFPLLKMDTAQGNGANNGMKVKVSNNVGTLLIVKASDSRVLQIMSKSLLLAIVWLVRLFVYFSHVGGVVHFLCVSVPFSLAMYLPAFVKQTLQNFSVIIECSKGIFASVINMLVRYVIGDLALLLVLF